MMPEKKERARVSPCNIDETLQRGQRLRGGDQREQRRDPQAALRSPPSLWERAKEAGEEEGGRLSPPLEISQRGQPSEQQRGGEARRGERRSGEGGQRRRREQRSDQSEARQGRAKEREEQEGAKRRSEGRRRERSGEPRGERREHGEEREQRAKRRRRPL